MSSRESSLGAWAGKIPQVEGKAGQPAWQVAADEPLSPAELGLELKGLGTILLVGLGLLAGSGILLAMSLNYVVNGEATAGVIVDHRMRPRGGYAPVVAYLADGEEYRLVASTSLSPEVYPVGREVVVLYLPRDPSEATIADFIQLYLFPTFLGSCGLFVLVTGAGLGVYVVKKAGWNLLPTRR
jgi:hypothetical protein